MELRNPPNEWSELTVVLGVRRGQASLHIITSDIIAQFWSELWRQEAQEQVKKIDGQCVALHIPTMRKNDTRKENQKQYTESDPSLLNEGDALIHICLICHTRLVNVSSSLGKRVVDLIHL